MHVGSTQKSKVHVGPGDGSVRSEDRRHMNVAATEAHLCVPYACNTGRQHQGSFEAFLILDRSPAPTRMPTTCHAVPHDRSARKRRKVPGPPAFRSVSVSSIKQHQTGRCGASVEAVGSYHTIRSRTCSTTSALRSATAMVLHWRVDGAWE